MADTEATPTTDPHEWNPSPEQIKTAARVAHIAKLVAEDIYCLTPPTPERRDSIWQALMMIAAHESDDFLARRQYGFSIHSLKGAFGLCQLEMPTIESALTHLHKHSEMQANIETISTVWGWDPIWSPALIARTMQYPIGDAIGLCLCRVFHLNIMCSIPDDLVAAAKYCKRYHNGPGAASWQNYYDAFVRWAPIFREALTPKTIEPE